jgi:multidrug efflux pump subunit AcrA (membrane-fusion protein)
LSMKWWTENLFKRSMVVVLSASLVLSSGCSLLPAEDEEEVLPEIAPAQISKKPEYEVTTATLETKIPLIGKLISLEEETMFFTLDGKNLKELNVKVGSTVKAGQVIGQLDVDTLVKSLRLERLAFRKVENDMKDTLRQRDEMDPVEFEGKLIAFEEQKQKLVDMEEEIAKATLKAPFAGTIVTLNVQKGDLIKAYAPIAIVADTSKITAAAKITKSELEKLGVGMEVTANITSVGTFKGKIKQLPFKTEEQNNGGGPGGTPGEKPERPEDFLIVDLKDLPKNLNRGMPLSINVITKRTENAIVIPPSTLRSIGSRTYVQVIEGEVKREVDVEVGQQTSTNIEILQGLKPGQKVVGR